MCDFITYCLVLSKDQLSLDNNKVIYILIRVVY